MAVEITIKGARGLTAGVWETALSPRDVRALGAPLSDNGDVGVLLVSGAFSTDAGILTFPLEGVTVLNVGRTDKTVIVCASSSAGIERKPQASNQPGDQQFLRGLIEVPEGVRNAGTVLLERVRQHFPGDLKKFGLRRYVESPDNFWAVAIQPRVASLQITVRGMPEHFTAKRLKIKMDRRPYRSFKVTSLEDVDEAASIIMNAGAARKLR